MEEGKGAEKKNYKEAQTNLINTDEKDGKEEIRESAQFKIKENKEEGNNYKKVEEGKATEKENDKEAQTNLINSHTTAGKKAKKSVQFKIKEITKKERTITRR